jgi:hypothetical protein
MTSPLLSASPPRVSVKLLVPFVSAAHIEVAGDRAVLHVSFGGLPVDASMYEFVLAAHVLSVRRMTGLPQAAPLETHFTHARPKSSALHKRISVAPSLRRKLALHTLRDQQLSLVELGYLLGFRTGPAFHRAFRRWTGTSVAALRRESSQSAWPLSWPSRPRG